MNRSDKTASDVPRALREVWEWKDAVCRSVKDLSPEDAVRAILAKSTATVRKYGVWRENQPTGKSLAVAEGKETYGERGQEP